MNILLLGFSSIARRRVLPALASLGIEHVDVASRSAADSVTLPQGLDGRVFDDYDEAIKVSKADIVYISTVNSRHAELAAAALDRGRHVVIDKPATLDLADTQGLVQLAELRNRLLAEATVYAYHPQIAAVQQLFSEIDSRPTRIIATFSFPSLPPENFRHRADLGGGALWDLGPYAITPGRLFFGVAPTDIVCRRFTIVDSEVESAFSLMITYPGDRSFVGHYGMGTGYINRLEVLGPNAIVTLDRVFTTPPDIICELQVSQHNQRHTVTVPAADSFACFMAAVLDSIANGATRPFADTMLADAVAMQQLRSSL